MRIAFIGLGNMGRPMALNLAHAGHEVVGYDVAADVTAPLIAASSAVEAVTGAEAVITMLPNGAILNAVYDEIVAAAAPSTLMIDCSTVDVAEAREAAAKAVARGLQAIDAPVSGGSQGAQTGTLTFMVGGDDNTFGDAKPLLEIMGQKIVHCGSAGAGQAAKLCNNMLLGISMLGVCEAFALADQLDLSREKFFEVASSASGSCWSLNTYCPAPGVGPETPADRGYAPGFAAELMLKDLELAQRSSEATGADSRMGRLAAEIYRGFVSDGGKGRDFSAYLEHLGRGQN